MTVAAAAGLVLVGATPASATPAQAQAAPHSVAPRAAKASTPRPGAFVPLTSQRLLDTRTGAPLAPRATRSLAVAGQDGMPTTGVGTVVLTVTAVSDPSGGYLTIYGDGSTRPTVASLNYAGGYSRSNEVFTQLGADGAVAMYNGADTSTNVTVDVAGYYLAGGTAGGSYVPVAPMRLLDTRTAAKPTARGERWVTIAGSGGLPAQVSAVVVNVAALQPTRSGHLDLDADARPGVQSAVFFRAGQSVSNLAIVTPDGAGRLALINQAQGSTGVTVDVFGYFVTGAPGAAGLFGPNLSSKLFDTRRIGDDHTHVPIPGRGSIDVSSMSGVPASASAVTLIVTALNDTAAGYLTTYPTGSARPTTATLDFVAKYNISDLAVVAPGADGKITIFNGSLQPVDIMVSAVGFVGAIPGPLRWTSPKQIDPDAQSYSMSCPSVSFCLAVDYENALGRSQYQTFDGVDWTAPAPTGLDEDPRLVSCSSPTFCVALFQQVTDGFSGPSEIYRNGVWSTGPALTVAYYGDQINDLSCTSPTFCIAVGGGGAGYEWMYDGTTWSAAANLSNSEALSSVSCVSAQFCLVAGQGPNVESYDGQTWTETTIDVNTFFSQVSSFVSCTSTTFCLVTSGQASQAYNGSSWSSPRPYGMTSDLGVRVACVGVGSCAGLSADGAVGFDTASGWTDFANLALPGQGEAIQCPSPSLCVVSSSNGYVSVGTPL